MNKNVYTNMLIILISLFVFSGCSSLEKSAAGKIGCPADTIQVIKKKSGFGFTADTYKLKCLGKYYICSRGPEQSFDEMSCSRMRRSRNTLRN